MHKILKLIYECLLSSYFTFYCNYVTLFMPGFQHYVAVSVAVSVTVSVKTVSVLVVPYAVAVGTFI